MHLAETILQVTRERSLVRGRGPGAAQTWRYESHMVAYETIVVPGGIWLILYSIISVNCQQLRAQQNLNFKFLLNISRSNNTWHQLALAE